MNETVRSPFLVTAAILLVLSITSVSARAQEKAAPLDPKSQEVIDLIKEGRKQSASGDYDAARAVLERALATAEKQFGDSDLLVGFCFENIGEVFALQGNYKQAESWLTKALSILGQKLGAEDLSLATLLNDLADVYRLSGQYERAEPMYRRVAAMRVKALGPKHALVAETLNGAALVYHAKG